MAERAPWFGLASGEGVRRPGRQGSSPLLHIYTERAHASGRTKGVVTSNADGLAADDVERAVRHDISTSRWLRCLHRHAPLLYRSMPVPYVRVCLPLFCAVPLDRFFSYDALHLRTRFAGNRAFETTASTFLWVPARRLTSHAAHYTPHTTPAFYPVPCALVWRRLRRSRTRMVLLPRR
jgi:hypothetical protein